MPNKAYKFRLYPTPAQKILLAKTFGCVRLVYNHWLDRKISQYKEDQTTLSYTFCAKELAVLKKTEEYAFLKEVDSISLQQSLRHLDQAFQNFFKRPGTGSPRFKSKRNRKNSYSTVCVNQNILLSEGYLKLPKIGQVKVKQHRKIPESYVLKSVTVSQSPSGKYHASISFEYENQVPDRRPHTILGLDFSLNGLYKDSEGNEAEYPKYYRKWEKQRIKVAKLYEKVANQRKDFLHKRSREIVNAYDCVCIEDLDMKTMARSLHFGKAVHDNGWVMFTTFLKYKLEDQGKQLIRIDKWFPSSQTCSVCGYKNPETKDLHVREWDCPRCKSHHDRDLNAAINIRAEGMRIVSA